MADQTPSKRPYRKAMKRGVVIDRDGAIRFLKAFGFAETDKVGVFVRLEQRKTHERRAGARYIQELDLEQILGMPEAWRRFVRDWSTRYPDIAKRLDEEIEKEERSKRGTVK